MAMDYLDCVSLTYPHHLSDEEAQRLVREIVDPGSENIRSEACEALASHGARVSNEILALLRSQDTRVVLDMVWALDPRSIERNDAVRWSENVVKQVEALLFSNSEEVRDRATVVLGSITHAPERYAHYLCDRCIEESSASLRYLYMTALSNIMPIPASCRNKLEHLLELHADDEDFLETVTNRISELEPPSKE